MKLALDIPAAAEACSVSEKKIREAIRTGHLKAKHQSTTDRDGQKVGTGKYLIRVTALEEWLDNLEDA